ncbi:MAG: hypothetical protein WB952_16330 [Terriglobales bacterium]
MTTLKGLAVWAVLAVAMLAPELAPTASAQDRSELTSRGGQSTTTAPPAPRPVQTVPPPASQTKAQRPRHRDIPAYSCVEAASNQTSIAAPPLSQSPSRVQEDPGQRVQAMPSVLQHSDELVQALPGVGEN